MVDVTTQLLTRPEIGAGLPQLVDDFFMRLVIPFSDGRKASITQASEPITDGGAQVRGLILDIDAFSTRPFEIGDQDLWQEFDELRAVKNKCFFESLKQETWEAFR